ncbi:hypothetical protein MIAR_09920 [Microbacterium arabinogalactanolyticum]|nr:hypothetical protein MIAR_09920 [Microbacterium arabinogalactanolyticum]
MGDQVGGVHAERVYQGCHIVGILPPSTGEPAAARRSARMEDDESTGAVQAGEIAQVLGASAGTTRKNDDGVCIRRPGLSDGEGQVQIVNAHGLTLP